FSIPKEIHSASSNRIRTPADLRQTRRSGESARRRARFQRLQLHAEGGLHSKATVSFATPLTCINMALRGANVVPFYRRRSRAFRPRACLIPDEIHGR